MSQPVMRRTSIDGLVVIDLDFREDERGWFEEAWNRSKLESLGLGNFRPVQQNISHNERVGTLRGLHAEPWDKYVTVANGSVFSAWVDLRPGPSLGRVETLVLTPGTSVFIPNGVANGFQTLEERTSYAYLVNAHWDPSATRSACSAHALLAGLTLWLRSCPSSRLR